MSKEPVKNPVTEWSAKVNGLCGRLLVKFEDLKPGLRHAIFLELLNDSVTPITISNLPDFHVELYDSLQQSVSTSGFVSNGPRPILQWAVIPRDAYVGLRVDMQTVGIPAKEHERVFLGMAGKAWELQAGKYLLEAIAIVKREESGPTNQWIGELKLPPVEVVVTDEMFSE